MLRVGKSLNTFKGGQIMPQPKRKGFFKEKISSPKHGQTYTMRIFPFIGKEYEVTIIRKLHSPALPEHKILCLVEILGENDLIELEIDMSINQ